DLRGILIEDSNKATLVNAGGAVGGTPQSMDSSLTDHNNADVDSGNSWISYGNHEYKNIGSGSWTSGDSTCQTNGGHLASIHSQEENDFIHDNYCSSSDCWVGLEKSGNDFQWSDGSKNQFTYWHNEEPNSTSTCSRLINSNGTWRDVGCSTSYSRICKRPLSSFENLAEASSVQHNGNLFLVGGKNNSSTSGIQANNNVWKSSNATNWSTIEIRADEKIAVLVVSNSASDNGIYFQDLSYNNHAITKNGAPLHKTGENKNNISSMFFPKTATDFISLEQSTAWDFGANDFTQEAWIYPQVDSESGSNNIMGQFNTSNDRYATIWISPPNLTVRFQGSTTTEISTTAPSNDQWTHIAVVRSGSTLSLYYDGILQTSGAYTTVANYDSKFYIGAWGSSGGINTFQGYIDQVRVTNGKALYTSNFTPPPLKLSPLPKARYAHQIVSFNSKLWIFGGMDTSGAALNDIWSSDDDGVSWLHEGFAAWGARSQHQIIEFGGELWLYGGVGFQDIWKSSNGIAWT
ncbi:LamG domain-containing protein, partial [bacterium]|nr:LamG domain-containing protein [bacterium]